MNPIDAQTPLEMRVPMQAATYAAQLEKHGYPLPGAPA